MDAVFNMGLAPYKRVGKGRDPFSDPKNEEMSNPRGVQKLVHVALQRICDDIAENQFYFVRHKVGRSVGRSVVCHDALTSYTQITPCKSRSRPRPNPDLNLDPNLGVG